MGVKLPHCMLYYNNDNAYSNDDNNWNRWQLAMHCNLRLPDIMPVVLSFDHEAHDAPA